MCDRDLLTMDEEKHQAHATELAYKAKRKILEAFGIDDNIKKDIDTDLKETNI